jgi:hypothetical protein
MREVCEFSDPFVAFVADPDNSQVLMWINPEDNAVISECPTCGVVSRHTKDELDNFKFCHEHWCSPLLRQQPVGAH